MRAVQVQAIDAQDRLPGATTAVACDWVAVSGGHSLVVHLHCQAGSKAVWDDTLAAFLPGKPAQNERSAGACGGSQTLQNCAQTDNATGRVEAIAAVLEAADATPPTVAPMDAGAMRALWLVSHPTGVSRTPKQFVGLQNDVAASDILLAVREGFESIEHVKRNTAMGLGTDPGKTGNIKLATRRQHWLRWQKRGRGPIKASIKGFQSRNEEIANTYLSFKLLKSLQRSRPSSTRTSTSAAPNLQLTPCTPSAMGSSGSECLDPTDHSPHFENPPLDPNTWRHHMFMNFLKRLLAALMLSAIAATGAQAACADPAGPNVNWSGCNKNGIRVPGANLSGANLSNALFGPTAKHTADFSRANLQGANFIGSNVPASVKFAGADLSGATWVDGLVCAMGSIGNCNNRAKAQAIAVACPSGSSAVTGSNTCAAVAGYFKDAAGAFNVCPAGSFCVAGSVAPQACLTGSSSVAGGKAANDCSIALAGYFKDSTGTLSACTAGSFCAGGNAGPTSCPAGTYSAAVGATGDKTCIPTTAGNFAVAGSTAQQACPAGSNSVAGAKAASECMVSCSTGSVLVAGSCAASAGFYKTATGSFTACPAGSFCNSGNAGPTQCPAGTYSASIGATGDKACIPVTAGNYAVTGSMAQQACPTGSSSAVSAKAASDCSIVLAGYLKDSAGTINICPAGSFCSAGAAQVCPNGSGSAAGAKATSDCSILLAGYFKDSAGMISVCPAGSFCTAGNVTPQSCPSGSNSAAGAKAATDCSLAVADYKNATGVSRLTCTDYAGKDYTTAKRHLDNNCKDPMKRPNCGICFSNSCDKETEPNTVWYTSNTKRDFDELCRNPMKSKDCPFRWCVKR